MRFLIFTFFSLISISTMGNGIEISNASYDEVNNELTFDIEWENAWKVPTTGSNYSSDGAWVFVKYAPNGGPSWQHLDIISAVTPFPNFNHEIGNNGHGIMLIPDFCLNNSDCDVTSKTVSLTMDAIIGINPDFKIFAFEMVKVPSDPFYLGDGVSDRTYYTYPDTLDHYYVSSSAAIPAGETNGSIQKKDIPFDTDIPLEYPKGYREFWAMKYKISMEQYVGFLNTLDRVAQNNRTETDVSGSVITDVFVMTETSVVNQRNPIRCDENVPAGPIEFYCDLDQDGIPNESNDGQNLIASNLTYNDYLAFLDWSALRSFSQMEYQKMCRGPLNPVAGEYAWGSSTYAINGTITNSGEASESFSNVGSEPIWPDFYATDYIGARCGFAATSTSTRLTSGATFYGIQDIHSSGSLYVGETTLSLQNFHYFNSQGDGTLASNGDANVPSWSLLPKNLNPSYFRDAISDSSNFSIGGDTRVSFVSGRGVVILQP